MSDASDTSDDAGRAGEVHSPGKSWPQREVPRHGGAQLICLEAGRGGAWLHNVCVCGSVIVLPVRVFTKICMMMVLLLLSKERKNTEE